MPPSYICMIIVVLKHFHIFSPHSNSVVETLHRKDPKKIESLKIKVTEKKKAKERYPGGEDV